MIKQSIATYGQTIFDLALEQTGSIEGLFDLMAVNNWSTGVDHDMLSGEQYYYDDSVKVNQDVYSYYIANSIEPTSGIYNGSIVVPVPTPPLGYGNELTNLFHFKADATEIDLVEIDSFSAGIFYSVSNDGSSGVITWTVNGAAPTNPQILEIGDEIEASRTISTFKGWLRIGGYSE